MAYVPPLASEPVHYSLGKWIAENEKFFLPPVCIKMMHNTHLKVFYAGGPNQRKDYHMEEGEEFFYMRKGDMTLKVVEGGEFKDIHIKEGEVFLLPGKIPHSPQRNADTVGLIIERERLSDEKDGLRYYVESDNGCDPNKILYQRWFHCKNLGTQLGPVIKGFFASEQYKTGKPIESDLDANPAVWKEDELRRMEKPFNLKEFLSNVRPIVKTSNESDLFDHDLYKSDVKLLGYGEGKRKLVSKGGETFLWQIEGEAKVRWMEKEFHLATDDVLLIPLNAEYEFEPTKENVTLTCRMSRK